MDAKGQSRKESGQTVVTVPPRSGHNTARCGSHLLSSLSIKITYIDTGYFSRSRSSVPCPARLTASAEPRRGWCLSQAVIPARGGSPDLPAGSPARPSAPRRSAWCTQVGAYLPTGWASSCVKAAQMCLAEQPGRRPLRFRSPAEQGAPHNSVGSLPPGPIGFDEIHAVKQYCPLPVKDGQLDGVLALIQDKKYRFGVPFIGSQGAKC